MSWILITANGEELDRRELTDAGLVIGRSPECDVAVRDILLSRTHCRIEPCGKGGWKLVDLNSKNGTRVGWQKVQSHLLRDGDHLRMGRTRISYHVSPFEPAPKRAPRTDRLVRPADPHEALSGTVTDFVLLDEEEPQETSTGPFPQPRPFEPASVLEPETESLLDELASSYWSRENESGAGSTALAVAPKTNQVTRTLPRLKPIHRQVRSPASQPVDISLQADASNLTPLPDVTPRKSSRQRLAATAGLTLAAVAGTAIVVMSIWLLTLAP